MMRFHSAGGAILPASPTKHARPFGTAVAETAGVAPFDVEQIARTVIREYGLPYRFDAVTAGRAGECRVGFSDTFSGATVEVDVWCDAKASPYAIRESLKRGLDVSD
jgi:hypothetical protein